MSRTSESDASISQCTATLVIGPDHQATRAGTPALRTVKVELLLDLPDQTALCRRKHDLSCRPKASPELFGQRFAGCFYELAYYWVDDHSRYGARERGDIFSKPVPHVLHCGEVGLLLRH